MTSCEACHAYQPHPGEVLAERPVPGANPEVLPLEFETAGLNPEPGGVDPIPFALLAGLVGMAAGMILAPWIDRWYKRQGK
jgi:hypothetical protein